MPHLTQPMLCSTGDLLGYFCRCLFFSFFFALATGSAHITGLPPFSKFPSFQAPLSWGIRHSPVPIGLGKMLSPARQLGLQRYHAELSSQPHLVPPRPHVRILQHPLALRPSRGATNHLPHNHPLSRRESLSPALWRLSRALQPVASVLSCWPSILSLYPTMQF